MPRGCSIYSRLPGDSGNLSSIEEQLTTEQPAQAPLSELREVSS